MEKPNLTRQRGMSQDQLFLAQRLVDLLDTFTSVVSRWP
jgi:hypothetical protein